MIIRKERGVAAAGLLTLVLLAALLLPWVQPARAAQPTTLTLKGPSVIHIGDLVFETAFLADSNGHAIGGGLVDWFINGQKEGFGYTNSTGYSVFEVAGWISPLGNNTVSVHFNGTAIYQPSQAQEIVDVLSESATVTTTTFTKTAVVTGPVVELSASDGSSVCPTYFRGNSSGGVWDQSTLTCTLSGNNKTLFPTFCVWALVQGCSYSSIGRLVIDRNVTFVAENGGGMIVYNEVDNYGTMVSALTNYGTVVNYGSIDLNASNSLLNLPYNGYGIVNNTAVGTINNWDYITNPGTIYNYGTLNNYGQFVSNLCAPCIFGDLVNNGTYTGSLPAPVIQTPVSFSGGNGTADQNSTAGVTVSISGAEGNNATVSTQVQGSNAPPGLGSVGLSSTSYFDILIRGVSTGTARVCITSGAVTSSSSGEMEYWNGSAWASAAKQSISGGSSPLTICGDIPVSALAGTPIAVGVLVAGTVRTTTTGTTVVRSTYQTTSSQSSRATATTRESTTNPQSSQATATSGETTPSTSPQATLSVSATLPYVAVAIGVVLVVVVVIQWQRRSAPAAE